MCYSDFCFDREYFQKSTQRLADPDETFPKNGWARYYDGQVNPCIESTYTFLDTVVASVKSLYQEVNLFDPLNPPGWDF